MYTSWLLFIKQSPITPKTNKIWIFILIELIIFQILAPYAKNIITSIALEGKIVEFICYLFWRCDMYSTVLIIIFNQLNFVVAY